MRKDADAREDRSDSFIRRAKDVINLLIVAVLGWVAVTVQDSTKQIAVLQTVVQDLREDAKGSAADRYTASSAAADFHSRDSQINHNVAQIEDHEKRIRELELQAAGAGPRTITTQKGTP